MTTLEGNNVDQAQAAQYLDLRCLPSQICKR